MGFSMHEFDFKQEKLDEFRKLLKHLNDVKIGILDDTSTGLRRSAFNLGCIITQLEQMVSILQENNENPYEEDSDRDFEEEEEDG
jgi:hypothetical protein